MLRTTLLRRVTTQAQPGANGVLSAATTAISGAPGYPASRFPHRIGYYLEDHTCDYDQQIYTHPQVMRAWYARHERDAAQHWAESMQKTESDNYNSGLHFSGDGPFEREMKRKGIQVEKYKLPSTVAMRRVHEMTVLRRRELERVAAGKMQRQRESLMEEAGARSQPTWTDETDGPVNPHFLGMVLGTNYEADENFALPRKPMIGRVSMK